MTQYRKIDVYFVCDNTKGRRLSLTYKHTTTRYKTCKDAMQAASKFYGLPLDSLRAYFNRF